jgi:hypothetical protein
VENNLELFARHLLLLSIALESKERLGLQGTVKISGKLTSEIITTRFATPKNRVLLSDKFGRWMIPAIDEILI